MHVVSDFLLEATDLSQPMNSAEGMTLSTADLEVILEQLCRLEDQTLDLLDKKKRASDPSNVCR